MNIYIFIYAYIIFAAYTAACQFFYGSFLLCARRSACDTVCASVRRCQTARGPRVSRSNMYIYAKYPCHCKKCSPVDHRSVICQIVNCYRYLLPGLIDGATRSLYKLMKGPRILMKGIEDSILALWDPVRGKFCTFIKP